MTTDSYHTLTRGISAQISQLRGTQPQVLQGFNALGKAALAPGALDARTKELIYLAASITNDATGEMEWHAADGSVVSEKEWAGGSAAPEAAE